MTEPNTQDVQGVVAWLNACIEAAERNGETDDYAEPFRNIATLLLSEHEGRVRAEAEIAAALNLLLVRYVTPDLVKLVRHATTDLDSANRTICRLRGETDADADLKRFVHYVDHTDHMSPGGVSRIIDFAQGQMARAVKAEAERDEARKALEPFADAARHLHPATPDDGLTLDGLLVSDWRRAAQALAGRGS